MNQMPNKISDWDLMNAALIMHKQELSSLATAIAEASNQQLQQDYMQSFHTVLNHQKQLFQLMQQRGFYQPMQASQQEIQAAAQNVNTALAQLGGPGAPPPGPGGLGPFMPQA